MNLSAQHPLEVWLSSLLPARSHPTQERLPVLLDRRVGLDVLRPAYASSPYDVVIGRNVIGSSTASYAFTGRILDVARLPNDR